MIVLPPIRSHLYHTPEATRLNQIDRVAKMRPTALLHAALQNLFARTDRARECSALVHGVGNRLFQIDVLARRQCIDRHLHVPVVRRRNDDRIDILRQHFPIIKVRRCEPLGPLHDSLAVGPIHVAHSHNLVRPRLVRGIEQSSHPVPRSNHSDAKSIVGAEHPG